MHRYIPIEKVRFREYSLVGLTNLLSVNESQYNYNNIKPSKNSSFKSKIKFLESCNNAVYLNDVSNINNVCDVLNSIMESCTDNQRSTTVRFITTDILPKLKDFKSFYSRLDKSLLTESDANSINDTISIYTECDRVLNNDRKLCKRFNINKFLRESINNTNCKDPKDIVFSLCEMIDTYNISPKKKYHIALENVQYSLHKSPVDTKNVVKYITDYFLLRESIIPDDIMMDYTTVVKNNQFIEPSELSRLKFVKNDERNHYLDKIRYLRANEVENNKTGELLDYIENINTEEQASFYIKNVYNAIITDSTLSDKDKEILKNSIYMIPLVSGIDKLFLDYEIKKIDGSLLSTRDLIETVEFINEAISYDGIETNIVCSNFKDIIEEFKMDQDKSPKKFIKLLSNINPDDSFIVDIIIKNLPELLSIIRYTYVMSTSVQNIEPILQELLYFIDRIIRNDPEPEQNIQLLRILTKEKDSIKIDIDSGMESKGEQYAFILNRCINNIKNYMNCAEDIPYNESCLNEFESDDLSFEESVALIETLSCGMDSINNLNKEELLSSISDNIRLFTNDADNLRGLSNVLMISNTIDKSRYENILIQRKECSDCDYKERSIIANEMYYIDQYTKPKFDIVTESLLSIEATNILIESFFEDGEEIVKEAFDKSKNNKKPMKKKNTINLNTIKLAFKAFEGKIKKLSTKVQSLWKSIDVRSNTIMTSIQKSLKSDRREAIIKGRIIPSMSQCIKYIIAIAGTSAVGSFFGAPYLGVLTAVGIFGSNKILNQRERILIYEEIDTELKVLEKEIELALQDGDTKKYRFLLTYQKKLQREKLRIKYGKVPIGRKIPV